MKFALSTLALAALFVTTTGLKEETKSIDQLYADAVAEGGKLIFYAGGDVSAEWSGLQDAFDAAFPKVNLTIVTDYSKYHDVRIDNQLETNSLVPDLVALQTLQDFPRWEKQGKLLNYKPAGFSQIYDAFKSSSGAWMSHMAIHFSFFYDANALAAAGLDAPKSIADLVDPQYAGHIASSYPNDDDAVLFVFKRYVETYGWDWVSKFANQSVEFIRGTNYPLSRVLTGEKLIGVASLGNVWPASSSNLTFVTANVPYLTWGQRIAILKKAAHPAAAKLLLNWILSKDVQAKLLPNLLTSTVRKDIAPPKGYKYVWDYSNSGVAEFPQFMEDRASLERWKQTFTLYIGEVQGEASPGFLGLHPGV